MQPYDVGGVGDETLELLESAGRYNAWLAARLEPWLGDENLELGAGHGTLTELLARVRHVTLVEPSPAGREVLERRFAHRDEVREVVPSMATLPADRRFDAVYSANVLEHVADDAALVREACARLTPRGHFVALVPAGRWLFSRFDARIGHHRRYVAADAERLARDAAVRLLRFELFNPVGALGWFVRMRLFRRAHIAEHDARVFDRLVPLLRRLDGLRLPLGQSAIMVFARP